MEQLTYTERVRSLAEKMAQATGYWDKLCNDELKKEWAEKFLPAARIAVAATVGTVAFALCESGWDVDCVDKYLKEQGLITDEKEVNNDL